MMKSPDFIHYRIPGQEKVRKEGGFKLLSENETPEGFVISDFKGENVYQFVNQVDQGVVNFPTPVVTNRSDYEKSAQDFILYLKQNGGKAVLSRITAEELPQHRMQFFEALCKAYPNAFVYYFSSKNLGSWIGATPETLIAAEAGIGKTMALAGTRKTNESTAWTAKEFEEHELVADFIQENLLSAKVKNLIRSERDEKISGPVKHLHTAFQFDLSKGEAWELARRLHPTPAVSGWPVENAIDLITSHEKHERKFYAGIIGVLGDKTKLYVNLRCAEFGENRMFLYVGGGFTKDSVIDDEWKETENKAATLINVLKNG